MKTDSNLPVNNEPDCHGRMGDLPCRIVSETTIEVADDSKLPPQPDVSVIMMTYNHQQYIAQAIEGVLNQNTTYSVELLIGEDCSTDQTRRIVLEYAAKHPETIRAVLSRKNIGGHLNALRLESAARGRYLAYCDGDDYWHNSSKIQKQVDFLQKNPDHVLVHARRDSLDQNGNRLVSTGREKGEWCNGWIYDELLYANFIAACTVCVRADIIREFGRTHLGSISYLTGDWPRWLYAARIGKIMFFNETMSTYRLSPGSVTRSGPVAKLNMKCSQRQIQRDFIALYGCSNTLLRRIEQSRNEQILKLAIHAGRTKIFLQELLWGIRYNTKQVIRPRNLIHIMLFLLGLHGLFRRSFVRFGHASAGME
jgi:glycosyltransferase involved in cell wall biosynthesis